MGNLPNEIIGVRINARHAQLIKCSNWSSGGIIAFIVHSVIDVFAGYEIHSRALLTYQLIMSQHFIVTIILKNGATPACLEHGGKWYSTNTVSEKYL